MPVLSERFGLTPRRPPAPVDRGPRRRAAAGFTFIEIFVVMAIIGILAGAVVFRSIGADRDRNLQTEAERLAALIELARGEAVARNELWGLFVHETRYGFGVFQELDGTWQASPKRTFRTRDAPPDVIFSLQLEGLSESGGRPSQFESWSRPQRDDDEGDGGAELPHVLILASGEQTPFLIAVGMAGRAAWQVTSDGISRTRAFPAALLENQT